MRIIENDLLGFHLELADREDIGLGIVGHWIVFARFFVFVRFFGQVDGYAIELHTVLTDVECLILLELELDTTKVLRQLQFPVEFDYALVDTSIVGLEELELGELDFQARERKFLGILFINKGVELGDRLPDVDLPLARPERDVEDGFVRDRVQDGGTEFTVGGDGLGVVREAALQFEKGEERFALRWFEPNLDGLLGPVDVKLEISVTFVDRDLATTNLQRTEINSGRAGCLGVVIIVRFRFLIRLVNLKDGARIRPLGIGIFRPID